MNFKRKKMKCARAGCLLCKPHKANGAKNVETRQELRANAALGEQMECAYDETSLNGLCGAGIFTCDWCLGVGEFAEPSSPANDVVTPSLTHKIFKRAA